MRSANPDHISQKVNPFGDACFSTLIPFLFVLYSRIFDLKFAGLHIPGICLAAVIAASILGGAFITAFSTRIGAFLLLFTLWLVIDIPFSIWKGGSFQLVLEFWPRALMVFVAVAGLTSTLDHCRRVMSSIACAIGVLALTSLLLGDTSQGRLLLDTNGKFSNPNDLAQALLMGLPFWVFMARNPNRTPFRQLIPLAFIGLLIFVLVKTGSRGGFVAFCVLLLSVLWNASLLTKIKLITIGGLLFIFAVLVLPKNLLTRYVTINKAESLTADQIDFGADNALEVTAVESSASRMAVLKESLRMTLTHPLFGVGPGMFPEAAAERASSLGVHTPWLETHNSYTQVSSECGLPALFFYLAALFSPLFQLTSIYRQYRNGKDPHQVEVAAMAYSIRASLVAFAVTACFASVAYFSLFPCLAGLSAAFIIIVRRDLEQLRLPQPAPSRQVPKRLPLPARGAPSLTPTPAGTLARKL